jgi:hypothetical protein
MAVRTARLALGPAGANALLTVYTCPAGKRTIVKRVTVWNGSGGAATHEWVIKETALNERIVHIADVVSFRGEDREVWWVLNPGDQLRSKLSGGTHAGVISAHGTELVL